VVIVPLTANKKILINDGAASETVTLTSVSCAQDGTTCTVTATFSNAHGSNGKFRLQSGTHGVQEAIDSIINTGGFVYITPDFNGVTADFTTSPVGANTILVKDVRGGEAWYVWNGSAYVLNVNITAGSGLNLPANLSVTSLNGIQKC